MLGVSDEQRLIRRPPFMSIIGLVAQIPRALDPLVSAGEDLDAQRFLVLHRDDLFRRRGSEAVGVS